MSKTACRGDFSMPKETPATAKFVIMMNDYFDIFNTSRPIVDSRPTKKVFGFANVHVDLMKTLVDVYN